MSPLRTHLKQPMLAGIAVVLLLACATPGRAGEPARRALPGPFAQENLHVWAYEEYDAVRRTPTEHARVLRDLGIRKAGYICRNEARVALFEAYVNAYHAEGIELIAVWTPVFTARPLEEVQIRTFLEIAARHRLRLQWWLTLEEDFFRLAEPERVPRAVEQLRPLAAEASRRGLELAIYGHGPRNWFTQAENQIAIVEQLTRETPGARVGIVYSFHQAFAQMDRFRAVFPRLMPHLAAINLNGNRDNGRPGTPIGQGDREQGMIEVILESGWNGPVGILSHVRHVDARETLQANVDGLRTVLQRIDASGARRP